MASQFLRIILVIGIIGFLSLSYVSGEKSKDGKKKVCQPPTHFAYELDYEWIMGRSEWYFPSLSKQDLIRLSSDILKKKPESLAVEELGKACVKARWDGLTPIISGYGGKETSYDLSPADFTNFNILSFQKAWKNGQSGTLYITHSDNKNFVFFVRCWEDGEKTWSVMATKKLLSKKVMNKIVDHLEVLGLSKEDVVNIDYDECSETPEKTEL